MVALAVIRSRSLTGAGPSPLLWQSVKVDFIGQTVIGKGPGLLLLLDGAYKELKISVMCFSGGDCSHCYGGSSCCWCWCPGANCEGFVVQALRGWPGKVGPHPRRGLPEGHQRLHA